MKFLPENSQISQTNLKKEFEKLVPYISELQKISNSNTYQENESSINLPFDEEVIRQVLATKEKMATDKLKYFVLIGIGGSNLGAKAVYDALYGHFDEIEPERFPKIIFLDTVDSQFLHKTKILLKKIDDPQEVIFNVISKSGKTTETLANLEILAEGFSNLNERLVITTDEGSALWNSAQETGAVNVLPIPKVVGGRFSAFSTVGLFPLACVGVNILNLLEGAMVGRKQALETSLENNFSAILAVTSYLHYKTGKNISETFLFSPQLESLGKWYRQLLAESCGKDGKGITPTVSIGSTDLHSMAQLYIDGPKDKFFNFVWANSPNYENLVKIPKTLKLSPTKEIAQKSANQILQAIYEGTTAEFSNQQIPFIQTEFPQIDEKSLGKFMQFKMLEVMFLAKLLEVNAFDQPAVEGYKKRTHEILSK